MGNNEGDKPSKSEKASSPSREKSNAHVYPDWAAVQAYYGPGALPPPYFNPAVTSGHAAHPYMWGPPQMMPPYGSPYAAMYPHGGIYGPSAAVCMQVATPLSLETPTRSPGNDSGSGKKPKESEAAAASGNGNAENAGDAGNHGQSQSSDCGTEGSFDRSDDSTAREDDNTRSNNGVMDSGTCSMQIVAYPGIDASAGNSIVPGIPMASAKPIGSTPMPTGEMNHHSSSAKANANSNSRPCGIGIQDKRELKREKRKQSNRESARRSRLRKQAEMEELGRKVDSLTVENMALRSEINKLVEDSEKLRSENAALMEKMKNMQGQTGKVVSDKIDDQDQEKSHMNTENLLSRVDNSVSNGDDERGCDEN